MVTFCLHTKFHTPSSNASLPIAIQTQTKHTIHAAAMLFHILKKKKLHIFRRSVTIHHFSIVSLSSHKFVRQPCYYY
jgi:hypothetical protein